MPGTAEMIIHVVTIFPAMFDAVCKYGVTGRAVEQGRVKVRFWNPRDYAEDEHRTVDDRPYGGGPGMVLMAPPLEAAVTAARQACGPGSKVLYLTPEGGRLDDRAVRRIAERDAMILLAGRYEGIDERIVKRCVDEEWSIGDYVLSGGELPAMVLIDAVVRQLPGALGNVDSVDQDSFAQGLLDCGHYTRPEVFAGESVPRVLLSGNHSAIRRWRLKQALGRTWLKRRDLIEHVELNDEHKKLLQEFLRDLEGDKL